MIPIIAGIAARRTDIFGVRSELFQVDGTVNVRGYHSLFRRSSPPKPYRSVLQRDFPVTGENPGNIPERLLENPGFYCPPRNEMSPLEERISIYLFGRSRVGTAIPKVVTVSRIGGQTALKQRRLRRPAAPPRCEASLECGDSSPLSSRASLLCGHVHKQGNNAIGKRS